jgi:hypothetical protein
MLRNRIDRQMIGQQLTLVPTYEMDSIDQRKIEICTILFFEFKMKSILFCDIRGRVA